MDLKGRKPNRKQPTAMCMQVAMLPQCTHILETVTETMNSILCKNNPPEPISPTHPMSSVRINTEAKLIKIFFVLLEMWVIIKF